MGGATIVIGRDIIPPLIQSGRDNGGQENSIYPTFHIHKSGFSVHVWQFSFILCLDNDHLAIIAVQMPLNNISK